MKLSQLGKQIERDLDAGRFEKLPDSKMKRYRKYAKAQVANIPTDENVGVKKHSETRSYGV